MIPPVKDMDNSAKRITCNSVVPFVALVFVLLVFPVAVVAQNSISGIVFDTDKRPVSGIEVELLDGFERLIGSRKTTGSGFYTFQRLNAGIYYLRVRPGGTGFKESSRRIDLGELNAIGGVDQKQVDFYLEIDRRESDKRLKNAVIFAQEVPEDAARDFEKAKKVIGKDPEKAAVLLESAVAMFPDYFEALEALGDAYLELKRFGDAEGAYRRAVAVNPKCFGCFFNLGIALNRLDKAADAADALRSANAIDSGSINSHLLLGIVLRKLKRFQEAEEALLRAKDLSGNEQPDVNWQLAELYYFELKAPSKAVDELRTYLKNLSPEERRNNRDKIRSVERLIGKIKSEIG